MNNNSLIYVTSKSVNKESYLHSYLESESGLWLESGQIFLSEKNRIEFRQAHCACAYVKFVIYVFFNILDIVKVLKSKNSQGS